MDITSLLISLASGVVGGNLAGSTVKEDNLGTIGNSIAGLFGGGLGNTVLQLLGVLGTGELTLSSILTNVGTSGIVGALLPIVVSYIKKAFVK